jgi:hypothetical protein
MAALLDLLAILSLICQGDHYDWRGQTKRMCDIIQETYNICFNFICCIVDATIKGRYQP